MGPILVKRGTLRTVTTWRHNHNLLLSLPLYQCQTLSVCLTHACRHQAEPSDKAHPVISFWCVPSVSLCLLGRAILAHCSHQVLSRIKKQTRKKKNVIHKKWAGKQGTMDGRIAPISTSVQVDGEYFRPHTHAKTNTHLIKQFSWSMPGWSVKKARALSCTAEHRMRKNFS